MNGTLILLRHGESQWNKENRFTGWVDVDISEKGAEEATHAGHLLKDAGIFPEIAFSSLLQRAIHTQHRVLDVLERAWIPEVKSWRLNERHYGGLQGKNKQETADIYGEEQVHIWCRSFAVQPPALAFDDSMHPHHDLRYAEVPGLDGPFTESLENTIVRTVPFLIEQILPQVVAGKTVLVCAHGNSLRGIIKYLEDISDDDITGLELVTGQPRVYTLDSDGKILTKKILA